MKILNKINLRYLIIILLIFVFTNCNDSRSEFENLKYIYFDEVNITDNFKVSSSSFCDLLKLEEGLVLLPSFAENNGYCEIEFFFSFSDKQESDIIHLLNEELTYSYDADTIKWNYKTINNNRFNCFNDSFFIPEIQNSVRINHYFDIENSQLYVFEHGNKPIILDAVTKDFDIIWTTLSHGHSSGALIDSTNNKLMIWHMAW